MWNPFNRRNLFSAKRHNKVANLVHSLCNLQVVRGSKDKITVTESNAILELKRTGDTVPPEGAANYKGLWSSATVYAVGDVVYTEPTTGVRMIWACEIAHGPGVGGYHTPTFPPDPETVYWRCYSRASMPRPFLVREHYGDYLGCQVYGAPYSSTDRTLIAKPHTLRFSVTSQTLRGETISYSDYNLTDQSRVATSTSSANQYVTEPYVIDESVIYAAETTTTVVVESVALSYIDLNVDGRAWAEY